MSLNTCVSPAMPTRSTTEDFQNAPLQSFDLLGIGFGPANLSLSVRLAEENLINPSSMLQSPAEDSNNRDGSNKQISMKSCFIESNDSFRWHPGMMIEGSRMQISFLKDLVTLRNPCSPFSFLNYLHCQNRLVDFINRATFTPTRLEFADYLAWVARRVNSLSPPLVNPKIVNTDSSKHHSIDLCYGERVVAVEGIRGGTGDIDFLRVLSTKSSDGSVRQYLCRNLVISVGGTPRVPKPFQDIGYESSEKTCYVLHTSTFLQHIDQILSDIIRLSYVEQSQLERRHPIYNPALNNSSSNSTSSINTTPSSDGLTHDSSPYGLTTDGLTFTDLSHAGKMGKIKIAVIGGGQSAAETFLETYNRLKAMIPSTNGSEACAEIDLIIKKGHLRPSDDSPFSNELFNPQSTDFFYDHNTRELAPRLDSRSSICAPSKLKDFLLKEAAATNYAVVNPETLTALYETMYSQKVNQGMDGCQFKLWGRSNDVKINIINYTEVISAEVNSSGDRSVDMVLENVLTRTTSRTRYHAVILGTGYSRDSWKDILFGKSAERPGSGINLGALWPNLCTDTLHGYHPSSDYTTDHSPTNSDILSGGLSDENNQESCQSETSLKKSINLKLSRNYRLLLPETFIEVEPSKSTPPENKKVRVCKFRPTVWLQGCNEGTHGISDSLLSVLSIRSGEIFDGINEEGWFGNFSGAKDEEKTS
ncbi:hypothetical protein PCASD_14235 [Puccinia coronata f. sp. avenae]|uniref:L-ornithine N(5)-monooxygenase [NAD(P)H] n=1 Tax=Puccinia coronata f. sp. avenae TaxID=200324 RepID=A0A2N5UB40_9BASI|nr:hypothetical protein PCASD_14235 [Puccinia coronata f. sp. avenae]